jgi:hypothetical protein
MLIFFSISDDCWILSLKRLLNARINAVRLGDVGSADMVEFSLSLNVLIKQIAGCITHLIFPFLSLTH